MAALVCDICGGKLIMGSGGIAVCDSCGMEHTKQRVQEKVQEIKGVVIIDNTHMIDNYLGMAQNAYNSGNLSEAESYCNKIIEIDPNHYTAWLLKGKSAGWQSTVMNPRFSEAISGFLKAINNVPEDERAQIIEEIKEEIKKLAIALISLRSDVFIKFPDKEETEAFLGDIAYIHSVVDQYIIQSGNSIPLPEIMAVIAIQINKAVSSAWSDTIVPEYKGEKDKPTEKDCERYHNRAHYCIYLLEEAILLCDEDDQADIWCYENMIRIQERLIYSEYWIDYTDKEGRYKPYSTDMLSKQQKKSIRLIIKGYEAKVKELKKNKIKKYWEEHTDQKERLDAEIQDIIQQIDTLNEEISNFPPIDQLEVTSPTEDIETASFNDDIEKLKAEKNALSIFKGKERKAIQEQISLVLERKRGLLRDRFTAIQELRLRIKALEERKAKIEAEFTKDR